MDNYIVALKKYEWIKLKKLPVPTTEQIKSIDNDCIRMYLYCYYGYSDFYNYKKKKLLNRYINKNKDNLMLLASHIGNIDLILYLEQNGLNINHKSESEENCYLMAAKYGHIHVLEYLESRGFDINVEDKWSNNSYILASCYNKLDVLKYLDAKCINKHKKDCKGFNAYLVATTQKNINIVKYLETMCIDTNARIKSGENAYMLAEIHGRLKTSNYLENKVLYLGHSKICSICYKSKDDKFITCKNNHIVHLK